MEHTLYTPFRFDVVGSFLRPDLLKQARKDHEDGLISKEELTLVEDVAIRDLIAKQKQAGLSVITDGEFRRSTWHLDFMWGFEGVAHQPTKTGLPFHGEAAMIDDTYLIGRLSVKQHPFVEHFRFVKGFEDAHTVAKQTIPAPAQFLEQFILPGAWENSKRFYASREELAEDIVKGYRQVIRELYDAGCRNLQFDDCSWGLLVDDNACRIFDTDEEGLKEVMELFLLVNNRAMEGKPADMVINTHVCRGNFHSTWASSGAYDKVAEFLFARENVNAYYLEFDDERSGGFAPLRYVSGEKKVVLGLVTTKTARLEDKEAVIRRIREASAYLPLDRLYVSTQCGFASCECGNKLSEEEQWKKIALVKEIAEAVWG